MPIEATQLRDKPVPFRACPKCGAEPFEPFLRGTVQRSRHGLHITCEYPFVRFLPQDYCAVICWQCKEVVGYESP